MSKPNITTKPLSWFLDQGCHQVPLKHSKNKVRWGHPNGYFLRTNGQVAKHTFAPSQIANRRGSSYPGMRECLPRPCHVIMAIAFYGERPIFIDEKTGKPYGGNCHHLIPDKLDYRPANLLCWLTRPEHRIADDRQKALKTVVPNGDLRGFDYAILRELQNPRTMSDADFEFRLEYLRFMRDCDFDPRIFTAADFHHWFSMPFNDFQKFFLKYKESA